MWNWLFSCSATTTRRIKSKASIGRSVLGRRSVGQDKVASKRRHTLTTTARYAILSYHQIWMTSFENGILFVRFWLALPRGSWPKYWSEPTDVDRTWQGDARCRWRSSRSPTNLPRSTTLPRDGLARQLAKRLQEDARFWQVHAHGTRGAKAKVHGTADRS